MGLKPGLYNFFHIPRNSIVLRFLIHLPSHPHTYPHHWNPDKQGVSDGKWGCEGRKRKKIFLFFLRFLPVFSCCFIAIHDFKMELVYIHLCLLSPSGSLVIYANLQCDLSSCHNLQDFLFLEILLIARNTLIINTNWNRKNDERDKLGTT